MDDLEAAEAYRREAEFYKEKAEENIRYKYLYLRLGGEMYEVLEILRRTPCACAPLHIRLKWFNLRNQNNHGML